MEDKQQLSHEAQFKLNKPQAIQLATIMETSPMQITHHPNPIPGLPSHFSSIHNLQRYMDDQLLEFRSQLHLPELEYWREEYMYSREQQLHARRAARLGSEQPASAPSSSASSQSQPKAVSDEDPRGSEATHNSNMASKPQSNHSNIDYSTAGGRFVSGSCSPLEPSTKSRIEVYIPPTILRLPIGFRLMALRAWYMYMLSSQPETRTTLLPPQRVRRGPTGAVVPWDKEMSEWSGSFGAGAVEVMKREGGRFTKLEKKTVDMRQVDGQSGHGKGEDGRAEWFERSVGDGETWDVLDGHVLGMDWACGSRGTVVLVHEEERAREKRKDSVLDKMVGALKRALSA